MLPINIISHSFYYLRRTYIDPRVKCMFFLQMVAFSIFPDHICKKMGIETSIIKGKRKMKGAENTELRSLGGLSLKTHEIIRTAKQHF